MALPVAVDIAQAALLARSAQAGQPDAWRSDAGAGGQADRDPALAPVDGQEVRLAVAVDVPHLLRATVITTNLPFKDWPAVFPGAACVGAFVARFVERCHVIDIDADSMLVTTRPARLASSSLARTRPSPYCV